MLIPAFLAGVLTVLAPCTLTLLPVIIGGSVTEKNPWKPLIVGLSLGISVFAFTLLLKVGTDLFSLDEDVLRVISAIIILALGFTMVFPTLWDHIQVKLGLYKSEKLLESAKGKGGGFAGSILLGAALGPVFSTCSPTYFYIIGTVLPQDFWTGVLTLSVYSLGLVAVLVAIGYGGRAVTQRLKFAANPTGWFRRTLGVLLVIVGILFLTGWDKVLETWILDVSGDNYFLIDIEENLMQMAQ
ncbi:sulfite exporter TauE/SafE family protein [Candidatus Peregrinibacteria bacterium]|nr:sulfite exporter TauE/SafE family protein [Candidatus Peregrinibacteria bacterium]